MINLFVSLVDIVLFIFVLLNLIGFVYLEIKRFKSKEKLNDTSVSNKKFKLFCLMFWFIVLCIFIIYYHIFLLLIFFSCFIFYLIKIFKNIYGSPSLSENDEAFYLASSGFYFFFFIVFDFVDFLNLIDNFSQTVIISLCLVYVILKIIIALYLLALNFVMMTHIVNSVLYYQNIKINLKLNHKKTFYYLVSMKYTLNWFTRILYFIFVPLLYILDILNIVWIKVKRNGLNLLKKVFAFSLKVYYNKNIYIVNILLISIIFSLVITYIFIITNQEVIGNNIKDIYELISTVIIIPLIFSLINRINSKSKGN